MRIVVADDNDLVRQMAVTFFEDEGHEVFVARDGHEAIDQVDRHQPHMILVDVRMPRMDGAQATRVLRARGVSVPIFAWTGDSKAIESSRHLFSDVFVKPIALSTVYAAMIKWLARGQSSRAPERTFDEA